MSVVPGWTERYVGIPCVDQGFSITGVHCWGLVWLVYSDLGIVLNKYLEYTISSSFHVRSKLLRSQSVIDPWTQVLVRGQGLGQPEARGQGQTQARGKDAGYRDYDVCLISSSDVHDGLRRFDGHVGICAGDRILHVDEGVDSLCEERSSPHLRERILGCYRHKDLI